MGDCPTGEPTDRFAFPGRMALLGAYATPATTVPVLVLGFLLVGGVLILGCF
jgi:hypothetical protein